MRKKPDFYKRNKGKCAGCDSTVGPFTVMRFGNYIAYVCHACLIDAVLVNEAPPPKKKKVIQEGLADAAAGRVSKVEL